MVSRKDPRNFGTTADTEKSEAYPIDPAANAGRYSVAMPERMFLAIMRSETARLADPKNVDDLNRLFAHFFDPMIGEAERAAYVRNYQKYPPETYLGYPRNGSRFPCYAVVLESDDEDDEALDRFIGQTGAEEDVEEAASYTGSMFDQTYGIYVYAENPDVCIYLYHFAKAILLGSHTVLEQYGILDLHLSGTEISPEETYIPENMFVRVVRASIKSLTTVPKVLHPDPARVRITGIWVNDIVVSGIRGGVKGVGDDG